MSGAEGGFSRLAAEAMEKSLEQNAMNPSQLAAREGKIPDISSISKEGQEVQKSLADKLTDGGDGKIAERGDLPREFRDFQEAKEARSERLLECQDRYQEQLREMTGREVDVPDVSEWHRVSPEEIAAKRREFTQMKPELIAGWEELHGESWPRYEEDVFDEKTGTRIRKAGDLYDAHHTQPLEHGGENTAENITPAHANDHYDHRGIHKSDSPLSEIKRIVKEGWQEIKDVIEEKSLEINDVLKKGGGS